MQDFGTVSPELILKQWEERHISKTITSNVCTRSFLGRNLSKGALSLIEQSPPRPS